MDQCFRGHLQGPGDVLSNGVCRACDRTNQKRYHKRRKLAMALLHAAEERGLAGGEAIALLQNADYWTLQACQASGTAS